MAFIKPFKALRPQKEIADKVASLPYDVMDVEEARDMAKSKPYSFLHVSRPEIEFSVDVDCYSELVYEKGRENLDKFVQEGILKQDAAEYYYIYRQKMGSVIQTGLVACASVDDYESGVIKKHEHTRPDKEQDRIKHIDRLDANDEPVFYTYKSDSTINAIVEIVTAGVPEYDFATDDGVSHSVWLIRDRKLVEQLTAAFGAIETLYVADGHHRSAAASKVREIRKNSNPDHSGHEEYNFFLTVIFPDNQLNIMPYNRVVKDLNHRTISEFMTKVTEKFNVIPASPAFAPVREHQIGMYLDGKWYQLTPKHGTFDETDAVSRLDVSILQDNLLSPILGIRNPRTDHRIHFVGGIRGVQELERLVNSGEYSVAFSMHPTSIKALMELADAGKIMPPKSTWFEPKLRSGLFVHKLM